MNKDAGRIVYKQYVGYGAIKEIKDKDLIAEIRESNSELVVVSEEAREDIAWM